MTDIDSGKKLPIKTLGRLGVAKRGLSSYYLREGEVVVPLVSLKDVQYGKIVSETVDRVLVKKADHLKKSTIALGDVVITIKGTNFRAAVVDEPAAGFVISSNLVAITLSDEVLPEIVAAYLNSSLGQMELVSRAGGSTAIKGLSTNSVLKVPIPVLPLSEQKAMSSYLSSAQEYEDIINRELELQKGIKDAIIRHVLG